MNNFSSYAKKIIKKKIYLKRIKRGGEWWNNLNDLGKGITDTANNVGKGVTEFTKDPTKGLQSIAENTSKGFEDFGKGVTDFTKDPGKGFQDLGNKLAEGVGLKQPEPQPQPVPVQPIQALPPKPELTEEEIKNLVNIITKNIKKLGTRDDKVSLKEHIQMLKDKLAENTNNEDISLNVHEIENKIDEIKQIDTLNTILTILDIDIKKNDDMDYNDVLNKINLLSSYHRSKVVQEIKQLKLENLKQKAGAPEQNSIRDAPPLLSGPVSGILPLQPQKEDNNDNDTENINMNEQSENETPTQKPTEAEAIKAIEELSKAPPNIHQHKEGDGAEKLHCKIDSTLRNSNARRIFAAATFYGVTSALSMVSLGIAPAAAQAIQLASTGLSSAPVPLTSIMPFGAKNTYYLGYMHSRQACVQNTGKNSIASKLMNFQKRGESKDPNNGCFVWSLLSYSNATQVRIIVFGGGEVRKFNGDNAVFDGSGSITTTLEVINEILHFVIIGDNPLINIKIPVNWQDQLQYVSCGIRPHQSKWHVNVLNGKVINVIRKYEEDAKSEEVALDLSKDRGDIVTMPEKTLIMEIAQKNKIWPDGTYGIDNPILNLSTTQKIKKSFKNIYKSADPEKIFNLYHKSRLEQPFPCQQPSLQQIQSGGSYDDIDKSISQAERDNENQMNDLQFKDIADKIKHFTPEQLETVLSKVSQVDDKQYADSSSDEMKMKLEEKIIASIKELNHKDRIDVLNQLYAINENFGNRYDKLLAKEEAYDDFPNEKKRIQTEREQLEEEKKKSAIEFEKRRSYVKNGMMQGGHIGNDIGNWFNDRTNEVKSATQNVVNTVGDVTKNTVATVGNTVSDLGTKAKSIIPFNQPQDPEEPEDPEEPDEPQEPEEHQEPEEPQEPQYKVSSFDFDEELKKIDDEEEEAKKEFDKREDLLNEQEKDLDNVNTVNTEVRERSAVVDKENKSRDEITSSISELLGLVIDPQERDEKVEKISKILQDNDLDMTISKKQGGGEAKEDLLTNAKALAAELDDVKRSLSNLIGYFTGFENSYMKTYAYKNTQDSTRKILDDNIKAALEKSDPNKKGLTNEQEFAYGIYKTIDEDEKKLVDTNIQDFEKQKDELKKLQAILQKQISSQLVQTNKRDEAIRINFKTAFDGDYKKNTPGIYSLIDKIKSRIKNDFDDVFRKFKPVYSGLQSRIEANKLNQQQNFNPFGIGFGQGQQRNNQDNQQSGGAGSVAGEDAISEINDLIKLLKQDLLTNSGTSVIDYLDRKYKTIINPNFAAAVSSQPSLLKTLYDSYVLENESDVSGAAKFKAADKLLTELDSNDLIPDKVLAITTTDKIIFVFITLFIRFFSTQVIDALIERSVVKRITVALTGFLVIYSLIFIAFVAFVNLDMYKMRIIFNYVNLHGNSSVILSHLGILLIFSFTIFTLLWNINVPIQGLKQEAINDEEKSYLMYLLDIITMIIWLFMLLFIIVL